MFWGPYFPLITAQNTYFWVCNITWVSIFLSLIGVKEPNSHLFSVTWLHTRFVSMVLGLSAISILTKSLLCTMCGSKDYGSHGNTWYFAAVMILIIYHSNIVCHFFFFLKFILNSCCHRTTGFSCFHAGSSACEWLALTHFPRQVTKIVFNVQHHTVPLWLQYSGRSPCYTPIPGHTGRARSGCPAAGRQRRSRRSPRRRSSSGWASRGRRTDSRLLGSSCPGSGRAAWLRWRYSPSCGRRGGRLVNKSICTKSSGICRSPRWQIGPGRNSFREI